MRTPFFALPVLVLGLVAAAPAAQAQTITVQVGVGYGQPHYGYGQPYGYGYRPYPTYRSYQPPVVREEIDEVLTRRRIVREYDR